MSLYFYYDDESYNKTQMKLTETIHMDRNLDIPDVPSVPCYGVFMIFHPAHFVCVYLDKV